MDYLKSKVGIYRKSKTTKGYYRDIGLPLEDVLKHPAWDKTVLKYRESITKESPKGDPDLKKNIVAYTPAGDYGHQPRSIKSELDSKTNLVHLDFDLEIVSDKRLKELFNKYKWIAVASRSASGKKFYLLVHTPGPEHYEEYFEALLCFFHDEEKLTVDPSVSSVNEIRFVGLSTEVMVRPDPKVWNKKVKRDKPPIERIKVPHDGKLVILPDDVTLMRHREVIGWAGIQNSNGVPLQVAIDEFPVDRLDPGDKKVKRSATSMLNKVERDQQITAIYEAYEEQHGSYLVPSNLLVENIVLDLPELSFSSKDTNERHSQQIVDAVSIKYLFKTDALTEKIYRYQGTHWIEIADHEARNFLSAAAIQCRYDGSRSRLPRFKQLMLDDLRDRTYCSFEVPSGVFNLKNGVLSFDHGQIMFKEHSDEYNFTYIMDYVYSPEDKECPIFTTFINKVVPSLEAQALIYQYIGAAFLPASIKFEKTLLLLGSGANGKSTLIDLISGLFGDAVGAFNLERITDPKESSKEMARIYNKIFGVCSEGRAIKDVNLWKAIVSKEKMEIKYLYLDSFVTQSYGRLITCLNEAPNIDGVLGSMRRAIIVGMNVQIPEKEQDRQLGQKLLAERSQILNLIIEGYKQVYQNKGDIIQDEATQALTAEVIDSQDLVLEFAKINNYYPLMAASSGGHGTRDERYERWQKQHKYPGEIIFKTIAELYKEYRKWCSDEHHDYPLKRVRFKSRFLELNGVRLGTSHLYVGRFETIFDASGNLLIVIGKQDAKDINGEVSHKRPLKKAPF